jgi:hypothetical protein
MDVDLFELYGSGAGDYGALFCMPKLRDNKRILMFDANGNRTSIYLNATDGKSGFMEFVTGENRRWNDKYYYEPIPKQQLLLNPSLKQPPGWEQ